MARILCVDDVPDNLKLLREDLEDEGYEVVTVYDGSQALEKLAEGDFAAVILDWMMPGLSGIETLKRIRESASSAELPVIMATALSDVDNVLEAFAAGANDYITKPIESEVLFARLGAHLQIQELTTELRLVATIDFLTNLPNRRHFMDLVRPLHAAQRREQVQLAYAMIDIDHFKKVNDTYGHDVGDIVLRSVADCMKANLRTTDVIGRLGGEEFAVVLYKADRAVAEQVLDRVRHIIEEKVIATPEVSLGVTVSIGVTTAAGPSIDETLKLADKALYRAKHKGRNLIEVVTGLDAAALEV